MSDDERRQRTAKQLEAWVDGEAKHNEVDGECCPDFSCCNDDVTTPKETRERFGRAIAEGDEETKMQMLEMFLGGAFATMGKTVYIAAVAGDGAKDA